MTGLDVCSSALSIVNSGMYVYWYGGKDKKCSITLLTQLSSLYPNIYNKQYISKCKVDIYNNKWCLDCSGFVCKVYGKPMVGTSQFDSVFNVYNGSPKNGMIVWRPNHCGIYYNGKVIEAANKSLGVIAYRTYEPQKWKKIYYDKSVDYNSDSFDEETRDERLNDIAKRVIKGEFGNGAERKSALEKLGYNYFDVQRVVNRMLR